MTVEHSPHNPAGVMMMYGGATAPVGWLLCQGQSLLRTDYPLLFGAIGTAYGSVDGTHFTLPDLQERKPLGKGATHALGATGGATTHQHAFGTLANAASNVPGTGLTIPNHTHPLSSAGQAQISLVSVSGHNIEINRVASTQWNASIEDTTAQTIGASTQTPNTGAALAGTTDATPSATGVTGSATAAAQVISGSTATVTGPVDPFVTVNFIIKT